MTHTPGPWYHDVSYMHHVCHSKTVCDATTICNIEDGENAKDNAVLIAAAPELLEALEWLVGCSQLSDEADWDNGKDPLAKAREIIAKAKGETA